MRRPQLRSASSCWPASNRHNSRRRQQKLSYALAAQFYWSIMMGGARGLLLNSRAWILNAPARRSTSCRQHNFRRPLATKIPAQIHDDDNNDNAANAQTFQHKSQQLAAASRLSLAPMMEYTDRHFRHVVRLLSNRTLLYSEMVAANAIAHERQDAVNRYLAAAAAAASSSSSSSKHETAASARHDHDDAYLGRWLAQGRVAPLEHASVLQLGGADPEQMYTAAQTVQEMTGRGHCDYTALNLNCGCPSPKVAGQGCFGAALMQDPDRVAQLVQALYEGGQRALPVTVKCRIGTDLDEPFVLANMPDRRERDYDKLGRFVDTVASTGVVTDFQVHARLAVLSKAFSPADNRKIPPLQYDIVARLVRDFPHLTFSLNGGVNTMAAAQQQLAAIPHLHGVMIGRAWAADPWSFAMADQVLYGEQNGGPAQHRLQVLQDYGRHADAEEAFAGDSTRIRRFLVKAVTQLFAGEPNAKRYRIALDAIASRSKHLPGTSYHHDPPLSTLLVNAALEHLSEDVLLCSPQESYERALAGHASSGTAVAAWQAARIADAAAAPGADETYRHAAAP